MAEMTTKILTVELQADKAINGIIGLNDAIGKNTQQIKDNNAMIAENSKAMKQEGADVMALTAQNQKLAQSNVELEAKTKVLKDERRSLQKEIQNEVRANVQAEGSLKALRAELSNLTKQYDSLSKSERQNEQVGGALLKQINSVTTEIKQAEEETQRYFRNVGNYPEVQESVKGALRSMQDEIINLTMEYRTMSDEMKNSEAGQAMKQRIEELTQKASEYKDAMSDVKQSIREGASDTRGLDTAIQAGQTLAATFGLAQNAAQALGLSTEGVQQAMLKMQQAMQAVQALQVIQNSLQKQSNLMRGIAIIQSKALAASEAIEARVKTQATGATIAQTVAQKAFNAVANANPYVLLATAILTVIGLVVGYTGALKDNTEEEKKNADAQKKSAEEAEQAAEAQKRLAEAMKVTTDEAYKRKKVETEMADDVANSVAKQLVNYTYLQKKWEECGNDVRLQKQFLSDYKTELDNTGFAVRNVYDAHNVLVKQADSVIRMYYALAEAAAAAAVAEDAFKRIIERKAKNTVTYTKLTDIRNASGQELDFLVKQGYIRNGSDNASEAEMLDAINKRRIEEARSAWRKENEADQKIIDYAMKRQSDAANNAKKLQGIIGTTYGSTRTTSTGGRASGKSGTTASKTPKKKEKTPEEIALEAYNKRIEELTQKSTELRKHALEEQSKENIKSINELAEMERQELYKTYGDREQYEGDALAAWDAMYQEIEDKRKKRINEFYANQNKEAKAASEQALNEAKTLAQTWLDSTTEGTQEYLNWRIRMLDLEMQAELEMYNGNEEMKAAIVAKYTKQEQDIRRQNAMAAMEIERTKYEAIGNMVGGLGQVLGEFGDESREMAALQKTLALGEIMIAQAVAIANAVKAGSNAITPWQMIAQIATSIVAVTTAMAQAFKSLNSAKFATGGYIKGAGTSTSDSIPVRVSNGESIMNANTTAMFSGLLSSLNQLGGGVPIQVQQTAQNVRGEDMLARAFARGVAMLPNPVVSVVDINNGQRQVEVVNERATL